MTTRSTVIALALVVASTWPIIESAPSAQQPPPPGSPGGRGGAPVQGAEPDIPLVARFDRNGDTRLNREERDAARQYLAAHPELRRPVRGGRINRTGTAGPKMKPGEVKAYPADVALYAADALRTLFLEFEHADWEQELAAFWHTDVEVMATLTVDGKVYKDVGISFRGNNSFTAVPGRPQPSPPL